MQIGEKIRELRLAKGWTQNKLADIIGTDNSLVSWWENDRCYPNYISLISLADVFNISLDELCCRDFKG